MLKNPKIYYNFFFGKHGQDFGSLFKRYYELFPEEADKLSPDLMDMYYGKNIQERCMKLLLTIKDKDNQITSKNINMINTIIVASVKYILEQKCMEPELDSDILTRDLMNIIYNFQIVTSEIQFSIIRKSCCKFMTYDIP